MNVRNCRKCGRVYNYVVGPNMCPSCRDAMDKKFTEVKEYVREHRGALIQEVADVCDVEVAQIHQWLREERLELMEGSGIVLHCETCGTPIYSGRFCNGCKNDMARGFNRAITPKAAPRPEPAANKSAKDKDRMRFL